LFVVKFVFCNTQINITEQIVQGLRELDKEVV